MNEAIKTIEKDDYILNIYQDDCCESPREWDNLTSMICFHKRYRLGDDTNINADDFNGWQEVEKYLKEVWDIGIIKPLYLFDHSGITISTKPFSCQWDSGQIGFVYITKDRIQAEYGSLQNEAYEKAENVLNGEVETYDEYLRGNVYSFSLEKLNHCDCCNCDNTEIIDSCCGFYGLDGIKDIPSHLDIDDKELIEFFKKELDNI